MSINGIIRLTERGTGQGGGEGKGNGRGIGDVVRIRTKVVDGKKLSKARMIKLRDHFQRVVMSWLAYLATETVPEHDGLGDPV